MKFSALIVDDEHIGRENLSSLLESYCPQVTIIGKAGHVDEAFPLINEKKPDVVFLDIQMPQKSGFDLLDKFEDRDFLVIFVTAYDQYGIPAIKAGGLDYLLKPIGTRELKEAVRKAGAIIRSKVEYTTLQSKFATVGNDYPEDQLSDAPLPPAPSPAHLCLPHLHGFTIVEISKIVRIEAENNCSMVYLIDSAPQFITRSLRDFEEVLADDQFTRVHRTHIINLNYLSSYASKDGHLAVMSDGTQIDIARRRLPTFFGKVNQFARFLSRR